MNKTFIGNIKIDKLRHLKNVEIEISKDELKHLIITGKNGCGKTSILDSIASFLKSLEDNQYQNLMNIEKDIDSTEKNISFFRSEQYLQEDKERQIQQSLSTINYYKSQKERYLNGVEIQLCNESSLQDRYDKGEFLLAYYNAKRNIEVLRPSNIEKIELNNKYGLKDTPSNLFIKYMLDLKTQQSFARNESDMNTVDEIQKWFDTFENSLQELMGDNSIEIKFNYKEYDFRIDQKGKEGFAFYELSDGYSAVLSILMDLMLRMEKNKGKEYDVEGIVLIDGIETHLHLELQKKILPFLTKFFPRVQFIVTTHSPFVLNSIESAVVYDLENRIKV